MPHAARAGEIEVKRKGSPPKVPTVVDCAPERAMLRLGTDGPSDFHGRDGPWAGPSRRAQRQGSKTAAGG